MQWRGVRPKSFFSGSASTKKGNHPYEWLNGTELWKFLVGQKLANFAFNQPGFLD
jgi:hypothetical protein